MKHIFFLAAVAALVPLWSCAQDTSALHAGTRSKRILVIGGGGARGGHGVLALLNKAVDFVVYLF